MGFGQFADLTVQEVIDFSPESLSWYLEHCDLQLDNEALEEYNKRMTELLGLDGYHAD